MLTSSSPLYAITDSRLLPGDTLFSGVSAALDGGCRWVQYRDKSNDHKTRLFEAEQLMKLCEAAGAHLIINDDPALAKHLGAGVHLGQGDGSPAEARVLLGPEAIIGVTCHASLLLAEQAKQEGASYIAFGRFFTSTTKPDAPPAPLALLTEARQRLSAIPIVAIGGITLENAQAVLTAGADLVAVSHGLFAAGDIKTSAESFAKLSR